MTCLNLQEFKHLKLVMHRVTSVQFQGISHNNLKNTVIYWLHFISQLKHALLVWPRSVSTWEVLQELHRGRPFLLTDLNARKVGPIAENKWAKYQKKRKIGVKPESKQTTLDLQLGWLSDSPFWELIFSGIRPSKLKTRAKIGLYGLNQD